MTDLDALFKRLTQGAGDQTEATKPGLILSFDAYCHLLGVEPNKENYDKWKETASIEAFENQHKHP